MPRTGFIATRFVHHESPRLWKFIYLPSKLFTAMLKLQIVVDTALISAITRDAENPVAVGTKEALVAGTFYCKNAG